MRCEKQYTNQRALVDSQNTAGRLGTRTHGESEGRAGFSPPTLATRDICLRQGMMRCADEIV